MSQWHCPHCGAENLQAPDTAVVVFHPCRARRRRDQPGVRLEDRIEIDRIEWARRMFEETDEPH